MLVAHTRSRGVTLVELMIAVAVIAILALHLRGRVPVILNFTSGNQELLGACRTAQVGMVCTSIGWGCASFYPAAVTA